MNICFAMHELPDEQLCSVSFFRHDTLCNCKAHHKVQHRTTCVIHLCRHLLLAWPIKLTPQCQGLPATACRACCES